mmetsp:Transcript_13850/g.35338  ORF Transcript_13850/g.35338 Transcript_13850/m.35338 type:complete len:694 (+) Transcript_13850:170-2251(+)
MVFLAAVAWAVGWVSWAVEASGGAAAMASAAESIETLRLWLGETYPVLAPFLSRFYWDEIYDNNVNLVLDALLGLFIVYLLLQPTRRATARAPLSDEEQRRLVDAWQPQPLAPPLNARHRLDLRSQTVSHSAPSPRVTVSLPSDKTRAAAAADDEENQQQQEFVSAAALARLELRLADELGLSAAEGASQLDAHCSDFATFMRKRQQLARLHSPSAAGTKSIRVRDRSNVIDEHHQDDEVLLENVLNLVSASFLGLGDDETLRAAAERTLRHYGCGSCGPRGFYGTIDVHIALEKHIAAFLGTELTCIYSSAYATATSILPCFAHVGDVLVLDNQCRHAIMIGARLSRARLYYYEHNDMDDLARVCRAIIDEDRVKRHKLTRRFIVAEGLNENSGDIIDLPRLLEIKDEYKFRIMLDESSSIGVLGKTGRGVSEHFDVDITKVDILWGDLGQSFGAQGGFCAGFTEVVDHQRLNASGYVFSASLPPYLAVAADEALTILEKQPHRLNTLRENVAALRKGLANTPGIRVLGHPHSPIIILQLRQPSHDRLHNEILLQEIVDRCLQNDVLVSRSKHSQDRFGDHQPPSIRVLVTAAHSLSDLTDVAVPVIHQACVECIEAAPHCPFLPPPTGKRSSSSASSASSSSSCPASSSASACPASPTTTCSSSAAGFSTPKATSHVVSPRRLRSGRKIRH